MPDNIIVNNHIYDYVRLKRIVYNITSKNNLVSSLFKVKYNILYFDNLKTQSNESTYANCGYFAGYKESGIYFTLPVANVVCDINLNNILF